MRIIHLSDLHFGTETEALQRDLMAHIRAEPADLVVVSGDFTQTGSGAEFRKAKAFLDSLGTPFFCVPGNHDIPRYGLTRRFFRPYSRYLRYICATLFPMWEKENVCIAGINTARRILPHWNWANGGISLIQLMHLENYYWQHERKIKICVMHHPVQQVDTHEMKTVVFGGARALQAIKDMKIDLVLTGHVHHASITSVEEGGHKTLFVSASTALSTRLRLQQNGYNVVTIVDGKMSIEVFVYENGAFGCTQALQHSIPSVK